MPHEQPATHDTPPQDTAVQREDTLAHEPVEEREEWLEEPAEEELPPRPRRRLLGVGGNRAGGHPIPLALLGVLLIACGFIGGVLVEKGENSSSSSTGAAGSLASRFRALRGGTSSASARSGSSSAGGSSGGSSGSGAGFTRPTAGTVAYLAGSTLYVTNAEGNTVTVTTSAGTTVTKSVKATVKGIHPGETVTITGETGAGGKVSAESISVGSSGGGLAALFGRSGASGGGSSTGSSSSSSSEPALFGR
jgi:hypothetical protein